VLDWNLKNGGRYGKENTLPREIPRHGLWVVSDVYKLVKDYSIDGGITMVEAAFVLIVFAIKSAYVFGI